MKSKCLTVIQLGALASLSVSLSACFSFPQRYDKVDFCWTSEHHVPPDNRFVRSNMEVAKVRDAVLQWIRSKNGRVISETNTWKKVTLHKDAGEMFQRARMIAESHWAAYRGNSVRHVDPAEWQELQRCTTNQVQLLEGREPGNLLVAMARNRGSATGELKVGRQITDKVVEVSFPEIEIFSRMEFRIFSQGQETMIYIRGSPVDARRKIGAGFGNSIGHTWWTLIDGSVEAELTTNAVHDISAHLSEGANTDR